MSLRSMTMSPRLRVNRHPVAVGLRREDLVAARPVEHVGVEARPALDGVGAVARVPHEGVVAVAEEGRVGATVAVDEVVARAAEEELVAAAAEEGVVALPTGDDRRSGGRECPVGGVELDEVVAAACVDDDGREAC